jgi:DoxX-like protein
MTTQSKRRIGYVLTGLVILFLTFDSGGKLLRLRPMVVGTIALGYPDSAVRVIGAILLVCLVCYAIPRTAVLGGVLLTGYLGGAVASNLRLSLPLVSNTLFPIYVGVLVWASLLLREERLAAVFPVRH